MDQVVVESFTLDHTKVKAPFVGSCGRTITPKGDVILRPHLWAAADGRSLRKGM